MVFGSAGYAAARLEDIAHGAGVSKATLYLYFQSKEAVFRELVGRNSSSWLEPEPAAAGFFPESAQRKLQRVLRHVAQALQRRPMRQVARLVSAERGQFPELARNFFATVLSEIRERLSPVLLAGTVRGEFRPGADAQALEALPAWLLQESILGIDLDQDPLTASRRFEAGLELLLSGVSALR